MRIWLICLVWSGHCWKIFSTSFQRCIHQHRSQLDRALFPELKAEVEPCRCTTLHLFPRQLVYLFLCSTGLAGAAGVVVARYTLGWGVALVLANNCLCLTAYGTPIGFLNNLKIYLSLIILMVALAVVWWLPQHGVNAGQRPS